MHGGNEPRCLTPARLDPALRTLTQSTFLTAPPFHPGPGHSSLALRRDREQPPAARDAASPAPSPTASHKHPRQRDSEASIGPEPDASRGGQLVPPAPGIPAAAQQPGPLAAVQSIVEDHLAGRVLAQNGDVLSGPAGANRATRNRFQDRELDQSERIDRFHL
jgi:hypothetical protein